MAKVKALKVVGVKPSTVAMFEGTFAAVLGLGVAILYSLRATVQLADATNSVLQGLAFGIGAGVVSIIVLPLIYFGIGWLIGYLHGWVFNVILNSSGGVQFDVED